MDTDRLREIMARTGDTRYSSKLQQNVGLEPALAAMEGMRSERIIDNFEDVPLPVGSE